jgi:translation initiation factor RLI1
VATFGYPTFSTPHLPTKTRRLARVFSSNHVWRKERESKDLSGGELQRFSIAGCRDSLVFKHG